MNPLFMTMCACYRPLLGIKQFFFFLFFLNLFYPKSFPSHYFQSFSRLVLIYSIMLTTLELIFSNKKILVISSFNYIPWACASFFCTQILDLFFIMCSQPYWLNLSFWFMSLLCSCRIIQKTWLYQFQTVFQPTLLMNSLHTNDALC